MLFQDGEHQVAMVSDFGLGKDYESLSNFSKSVGAYGQQYYVAPEQFNRLGEATKQSDIYSLGKLLYFVITGKDPLIINSTVKFRALIEKAVQEDPADRHNDIEEFIEQYERLKGLYLKTIKAPKYQTMKQYLESNKSAIDWWEFHRFVLDAKIIDHVFSDYLHPIVELLNWDNERLAEYISVVNESINDFLSAFIKNFYECNHQTGWPFRYLDDFGAFFDMLHRNVPYHDSQLQCLKALWEISFKIDQWAPQKRMESLLRSDAIAQENIEPFAEFLMESTGKYAGKIIDNGRLSEINPMIRDALLHLLEEEN